MDRVVEGRAGMERERDREEMVIGVGDLAEDKEVQGMEARGWEDMGWGLAAEGCLILHQGTLEVSAFATIA